MELSIRNPAWNSEKIKQTSWCVVRIVVHRITYLHFHKCHIFLSLCDIKTFNHQTLTGEQTRANVKKCNFGNRRAKNLHLSYGVPAFTVYVSNIPGQKEARKKNKQNWWWCCSMTRNNIFFATERIMVFRRALFLLRSLDTHTHTNTISARRKNKTK